MVLSWDDTPSNEITRVLFFGGITYLIGRMKLKLLFHGPLAK